MLVLVGPSWSSPSLFGLYQDKKIHTRKSPKMEKMESNMPSMRLSPRRIKSTPTMILYELRMIGLKTRPSSLLRKLEAIIKKWKQGGHEGVQYEGVPNPNPLLASGGGTRARAQSPPLRIKSAQDDGRWRPNARHGGASASWAAPPFKFGRKARLQPLN